MTTPAMTATAPTYQLVIEPGLAEKHYWRDLWRYRELFYVLAWRDVSVRYKQTIIGLAWALLQPFFTMVVFTIVFGKLAQMPTEGDAPYALNPMVGVIDGFRWAILGGEVTLYWPGFLLTWGLIGLFLWLGIRQFRRMEKNFADLI